jgi:LPS export ABC transporter protein LptC
MTYRIASIIAFIAIVVAGWIALDRVQNSASASPPNTALTQDPGYAARDAQLIETGDDGLPMYTLRASLIQQQPATQLVTLDAVQMQVRDPDGDIWSGRADHGRIEQDDALVELNGAVRLWGQIPGDSRPAQVATEQLFVNTRTDVATSPAAVLLSWGPQELSGTGLEASLNGRRLKLESNVHGVVHP